MKNKGFTLVELIVTIALLAAIAVTVGVSMSGMFERHEKKEICAYKKNIEDAACVYAEIENITNGEVYIKDLINGGYLKTTLKNPEDDTPIKDYPDDFVNVDIENNQRKCTYDKIKCE